MEMPKNFSEGKALYKEATGVEFMYRGDEPPRDAAYRLAQWCKEYIDDNSRGNCAEPTEVQARFSGAAQVLAKAILMA